MKRLCPFCLLVLLAAPGCGRQPAPNAPPEAPAASGAPDDKRTALTAPADPPAESVVRLRESAAAGREGAAFRIPGHRFAWVVIRESTVSPEPTIEGHGTAGPRAEVQFDSARWPEEAGGRYGIPFTVSVGDRRATGVFTSGFEASLSADVSGPRRTAYLRGLRKAGARWAAAGFTAPPGQPATVYQAVYAESAVWEPVSESRAREHLVSGPLARLSKLPPRGSGPVVDATGRLTVQIMLLPPDRNPAAAEVVEGFSDRKGVMSRLGYGTGQDD